MEQSQEVRSYPRLSTLEGRKKQAGLPIDLFGNEVIGLTFELDGLLDDGHRDFEQGRRCLNQFIVMDGSVTIFSKLLQHMTDTSLRTDDRVPWNSQPLRQSIRRLEANAMDIEG